MAELKRKEKIIPLEVYTDGSCKKRGIQTFGAWAYVIVKDGKILTQDSGSSPNSTNQRMELLAAIKGLEAADMIKQPLENIILYSDSAYLINCYSQEWYIGWRANGWKNAARKEVANQDLWIKLVPYFEKFGYIFKKVKGHADNLYNNLCDEMAQREAEQCKINWRGQE